MRIAPFLKNLPTIALTSGAPTIAVWQAMEQVRPSIKSEVALARFEMAEIIVVAIVAVVGTIAPLLVPRGVGAHPSERAPSSGSDSVTVGSGESRRE